MPDENSKVTDGSVQADQIVLRSSGWAVVVAAFVSGLMAMGVVTIEKIIAPRLTEKDVIETIRDHAPKFEFFKEIRTDKNSRQPLPGKWQICTLVTAGTVHQNQACTCAIDRDANGSWFMDVLLDEKVDGSKCKCRAACFDFQSAVSSG